MAGRNEAARERRVVQGTTAEPAGIERDLEAGRSVTIGDVITLLRPEFPDLTISKLRFLEDQGLVEPDRTPSGYRKFARAHVDRLRTVLVLQRDHYLPLRVIRDVVGETEAEGSGRSRGLSVVAAPGPPAPRESGQDRPASERAGAGADASDGSPPRDKDWLGSQSGADDVLLAELVEHGLLDPAASDFDGDDVEVARATAALARHGLRPRHLRVIRTAAEREADLVDGVVAPLRAGRRAEADDTRRDVAAALLRLHAALLARRLG